MVAAPFKPSVDRSYVRAMDPQGFGQTGFSDAVAAGFDTPTLFHVNPWSEGRSLLGEMSFEQRTGDVARRQGQPFEQTRRGRRRVLADVEDSLESAESLSEKYKHLGMEFDRPMSKEAAESKARAKEAELRRQEILSANDSVVSRTAGALVGGLAGAAVDPLELATAMFPIVSGAQRAWLAAKLGRGGAATTAGVVEGAVGNVLVEPLYYGASKAAMLDYTMADAVMNVGIGAVLGGGLGRAFGGKAIDEAVRQHAPEMALAQVLQGKTVEVADIDPEMAALNRNEIAKLRSEVERQVYALRKPGAEEDFDPAVDLPMSRQEGRMIDRQARKEARAAGEVWASFFESAFSRYGITVEQIRDILPEIGRITRATDTPEGALRQQEALTRDEREALQNYEDDSKPFIDGEKDIRPLISALAKSQIEQDRVVYRGTHLQGISAVLGARNLRRGQTINVDRPWSTSARQAIAESFSDGDGPLVTAKINVKGGTHGALSMRNYDDFETEVLLGPGSYTVRSIERSGDRPLIELDYKPLPSVTASSRALFQSDRGFFDRATGAVGLFRIADASTFMHESAHVFLDILGRVGDRPDASPELKADLKTLYDWMGTENHKTADTPSLERFARGFEGYLRNGKAPVPRLQRIFDMFASWLRKIYTRADQLDVEISPEVRGVMDRLLTTQDELPSPRELAAREADPRRDRLADYDSAAKITDDVSTAPDDEMAEMSAIVADLDDELTDVELTEADRADLDSIAGIKARVASVGETARAMAACFRGA